jgi:pyridoxamine 5'-phosphate oxidase
MSETDPIEHQAWLTTGDLAEADEPLRLFGAWLEEASRTEPRDPNAMTLATVDEFGMPNARMVLLKGVDDRGFVFYTNLGSRKGQELATNQKAALVFYWKSLNRQVRVRGATECVTDAEADAYFATRPRLAQIGAWASKQSQPLESRLALEKAVALYTARYAFSVPRPQHWSGFRIVPTVIEFWQDRPFRLHDRIEFRRDALSEPWQKMRLYP